MDSKFFKIGDIFNVEKGLVQSSKNVEGQFYFITASTEWKTHNEYSHDCEALVFAAGAAGSLGRTHYVNGKFIASDLCFVLTPKDNLIDKVDLKFYFYYFNLNKDTIVKSTATGTSKAAINMKNFISYFVPLPSIEYQKLGRKRIEKFELKINELDLIFEENLTYINRLRQSILQEAVQGKLVPQNPNDEPACVLLERIKEEKERLIKEGKINKEKPLPPITEDEIPYELPKGWECVRLINISKVIEYGTSSKASNINIGVPVLRMNNIQNGKIVFSDLKYLSSNIKDLPRLYLKKSDLLFNRTNSYELVGKTGIYLKDDNLFTFASYLIRITLFNEFIDARFINYYMNSLVYRQTQIEPEITQQNGQANYNGTKLKNTIIPLPPLNEQKRIVEKLDQLMAFCDELEKNIEQSKKDSELLMQSVLQKAFNGAQ